MNGRQGRAAWLLGSLLGAVSLASCVRAAPSASLVTYYLSPSGNNGAAGTSPSTAWRSLSKASSVAMPPGTRLLLQGGQRFAGNLTLDQRDGGDAARPVLVSSYGTGRATIAAASGSGIAVYDTAGVDIRDLYITGPSTTRQVGAGINAYSNVPGNRKLDHITIAGVDISGFANGIAIGGGNGTTGFRDVQISDSVLHGNLDAGLLTYGPPFLPAARNYANQDVQVSRVTAYQNPGNPRLTAYSSGNGMVFGSVKNGAIEWSAAYDNGGAGGSQPGSEGIWAYNSSNVTIAHNLSYDNRTGDGVDGNGFGLDQNTSGSCLEYNVSYGNDGAGYLLYSVADNGAATGNTVRFNISSGNAQDRNHHFGGVTVSGFMRNTGIYQNTVVMQAQPGNYSPALVLGGDVHGITVRNNIFMSPVGPIVVAHSTLTTSAALLQGNDYAAAVPDWSVLWGPTTYTSLATWRSATGQEIVAGRPAGFTADPRLAGPFLGLRSGAPGSAGLARGFVLRPGSPLIGAGLDLSRLFGGPPGLRYFSGALIPARHPDIGAQ